MLKKKVFASWDRFVVPYPFARGLYVCGKPIWVSAGATDADLEAKRLELEASLNAITAQADEAVSR
jgi:lysophospholipid acyltransferase (LPLAT)-like uncharacterized protein